METVAQKQWMVLGRDEDGVRMEEIPTGAVRTFPPGLLPDDVQPGDSFRVVAQLERGTDRALDPPAFLEGLEARTG